MSNCNPFLTSQDLEFIQLAQVLSLQSKDPNRKVGCLLTLGGEVIAKGYNRFPRVLSDDLNRFKNPDYKRRTIIHAEYDAILDALDSQVCIKGSTAYITYHPCPPCASCLIEAGIAKIVCPSPSSGSPKWHPDFKVASDNLCEAGVLVLYFD